MYKHITGWRLLVATWAIALGGNALAQDSAIALELDEAATLAITSQPLLDGLGAQQRAARESSIAAGQLPDPQFRVGVADLPIDTRDAGSLRRDADTQIQVGLLQEFPLAQKRKLRGEQLERDAQRLGAEHHLALRSIRRDASLAWLELWRYEKQRALARASAREAETQLQAAEIALRTGTVTQAEYLAARQDHNRLQDDVRDAEQSIEHARSALSRWIGDAAFRPVCPDLPEMPTLPPLETLRARVLSHPHLAGAQAQVQAAQAATALAEAAYRSDWRVQLGYGHRPAYSEMVTLEIGVDLPIFTRNRQDRGLGAALAQKDAADSAVEDAKRQLLAEARLNHHDFLRTQERLDEYDAHLLPDSQARIEAAVAGWRAGRNDLRDALDARRMALETQMSRLDLQHDLAKHFVQLTYLGAYAPMETDGAASRE